VQADQRDVGLGGHPGDRGADVVEADGADPAQVLGHDHVRGQVGQQLDVDVVDGQRVGDEPADRTVHAGAGGKRPDPGPGQHGPAGHHLWRVVALVGDADQLVVGAHRGHDLGRRGQQGHDPGHGPTSCPLAFGGATTCRSLTH
jgi:hypothetical protein